MKPIYTAFIKNGDKEHALAFPLTYRRLTRALNALGCAAGVSPEDDEAYIEEYRSRVGAAPDKDTDIDVVNGAAECMALFTPAQVKAVKSLNAAFGLTFWNTKPFLAFLAEAKGVTPEYIAGNGVPAGYGPAVDYGDYGYGDLENE